MKTERLRTRTVGCKVSEAEYASLTAQAERAQVSLSEWCREVLLERSGAQHPGVVEQAVMSEVLALRTILLNLHFAVSRGEAVTSEKMHEIIERADADKLSKALERLRGVTGEGAR